MKNLAACATHTPLLEEQLREHSLKVTQARLGILDVLTHAKKPISINELSLRLQHIDLATLYRTVETLKDLGIVTQVDFHHGHAHYELATRRHHHHLICQKCGKVVDLSKCDTSGLERQALKIGGFAKINSHSLEFFGICNACKKTL
jgi:Fe2+ or Zn2+ uptake regulation protein